MNLAKAEMKALVTQDIGRQLEPREQSLRDEANRLEGANGALKQAIERFETLKSYYRKEVEEGHFEEANLDMVFRAIDRCAGAANNLAERAAAQRLVKLGEASEAKATMDLIEKLYNEEKKKVQAVTQAIEDGSLSPEDVSAAPGGGIAVRLVDGRPPRDAVDDDIDARRAAARAAKEAGSPPPTEPVAQA